MISAGRSIGEAHVSEIHASCCTARFQLSRRGYDWIALDSSVEPTYDWRLPFLLTADAGKGPICRRTLGHPNEWHDAFDEEDA